jgi:hypothetical protein
VTDQKPTKKVAATMHPEARIWAWAMFVLLVLGPVFWMWTGEWRWAVTGLALSFLAGITTAMINAFAPRP